MQEPASVLFSFGNGYMHYQGLQRYRRRISSQFAYYPLVVLYGYSSIMTWFCSAVFHTRDLPTTEKVKLYLEADGLFFSNVWNSDGFAVLIPQNWANQIGQRVVSFNCLYVYCILFMPYFLLDIL
jgi:hypothetical protein